MRRHKRPNRNIKQEADIEIINNKSESEIFESSDESNKGVNFEDKNDFDDYLTKRE